MASIVEIIAEGLDRAVPGKGGWAAKHQKAADLANLAPEYRRVVRVLWDVLSDVLEEAEFPARLDSRLRGKALKAIARAQQLGVRDPALRRRLEVSRAV